MNLELASFNFFFFFWNKVGASFNFQLAKEGSVAVQLGIRASVV